MDRIVFFTGEEFDCFGAEITRLGGENTFIFKTAAEFSAMKDLLKSGGSWKIVEETDGAETDLSPYCKIKHVEYFSDIDSWEIQMAEGNEAERLRVEVTAKDAEITNYRTRLEAISEKYERLKSTQAWAEISLGDVIPTGTEVTSLLKIFRALKEHKKGIVIPSLDKTNWEELNDD